MPRNEPSRREFLQIAAVGGASLLGLSFERRASRVAATEALLLSCMDYRLMDDIERYMAGRGLRDKYDHVVLAGASLGAITQKYPAWNQTFWEHLEIAIALHHIPNVILMDHRDCGAYKVILGDQHTKDPAVELNTHATELRKLKGMIGERFPAMKVEMLLMGLDGRVEVIS